MLLRIVIENVFSFGERKEFNTIPNHRLGTLLHHKYSCNNFEYLKISSLYGANGAGKSNMIKALDALKRTVSLEQIPFDFKKSKFKFGNKSEQFIAVEFIQDETAYYYAIVIEGEIIKQEELYISGLGKQEDKLVYERKTSPDKITKIKLLEEFEDDEKSQLLKDVLLEEFVKPNAPVLKLFANRDNKFIKDIKKAFQWFSDTLQIITPDSKPRALAQKIDKDLEFKKYTDEIMSSFNLGIDSVETEKKDIYEFFGKDNENELNEIIKKLEDSPNKILGLRSRKGDEIIIVKEDDKIWVKILKISHSNINKSILFDLDEESDGTVRLLDFVPAFKHIISDKKVYVIDEIERSIHPLLVKELVKKFSLDTETKGQLIFTTHESNLLDQEIFRQDEVWFAEKDLMGSTDLYSLNDFKEHKTIDIRKGYLNGRYGSIPFLGNLKDLNWHQYDFNK